MIANKDGSDLFERARAGPSVPWDSPKGAGTPSVPSDTSSSTEFPSSSSPSSPGPLKILESYQLLLRKNLIFLALFLPSWMVLLLPNVVLCLIGPSVEELLGYHQEKLLELE
ncbi:hypothetical protein O181_003921 [Austropuccinia psidii MF-1]|uniref:Uncharacterized protein n=1 Tax=Austropuccinia psidii MF-1 TaxID=1389203 RepID=A0A9Q3BEJ5_9BASI|nr:hypothetical protein [Austropuccinia psidii MF-1]